MEYRENHTFTAPATVLAWRARNEGATLTLVNMHGDAHVFTEHQAHFPLTMEGSSDLAFLMLASRHCRQPLPQTRTRA